MMVDGWYVGPALSDAPGKVWLQCPDGEGGDFPASAVESALADGFRDGDMAGSLSSYFWENF